MALHQTAPKQPHADRGLYRPILHHHLDLLLSDMVSGLSRSGARHVDPRSRNRRISARNMRIFRRCAWRTFLRFPFEKRLLFNGCEKNADHPRHVDVMQHDHLQLCRFSMACRLYHVARVLWKGLRRVGLGCRLGYFPKGVRGFKRGHLQYIWKYRVDYYSHYHRLYC